MKTVKRTVYVAHDDTEFTDRDDCLEHDAELKAKGCVNDYLAGQTAPTGRARTALVKRLTEFAVWYLVRDALESPEEASEVERRAMAEPYPRVRARPIRRARGRGRILCSCCDNPAFWYVEVRWNYMRGDDDLWKLCNYHHRLLIDAPVPFDALFLLSEDVRKSRSQR